MYSLEFMENEKWYERHLQEREVQLKINVGRKLTLYKFERIEKSSSIFKNECQFLLTEPWKHETASTYNIFGAIYNLTRATSRDWKVLSLGRRILRIFAQSKDRQGTIDMPWLKRAVLVEPVYLNHRIAWMPEKLILLIASISLDHQQGLPCFGTSCWEEICSRFHSMTSPSLICIQIPSLLGIKIKLAIRKKGTDI